MGGKVGGHGTPYRVYLIKILPHNIMPFSHMLNTTATTANDIQRPFGSNLLQTIISTSQRLGDPHNVRQDRYNVVSAF